MRERESESEGGREGGREVGEGWAMGSMIEHLGLISLVNEGFTGFYDDSFCLTGQKQGKWRAKVGKFWQRINLIKVGCRII